MARGVFVNIPKRRMFSLWCRLEFSSVLFKNFNKAHPGLPGVKFLLLSRHREVPMFSVRAEADDSASERAYWERPGKCRGTPGQGRERGYSKSCMTGTWGTSSGGLDQINTLFPYATVRSTRDATPHEASEAGSARQYGETRRSDRRQASHIRLRSR